MNPDHVLRHALDNAYETFAIYRRPARLDMSPVHEPADFQALLITPLRTISVDAMIGYATSAMTTVGDVEDYKYFLPRMLELAVASALNGPEMIANKLLYGQWQDWPRHEVTAIVSVFQAAFTQAVGEHTDDYLAEPWFLGAVQFGLDVGTLMRILEAGPLPNAMLQLTVLFDTTSLFRSRLNGTWADIDGDVVKALRVWLLSDIIADRLIGAATLAADRDIWMLDTALNIREVLVHEFG